MKVLMCPWSEPGYLYPAVAIGLELQRRGDEVTILGNDAACRTVTAAGLHALAVERFGTPLSFRVSRWFHDGAEQYHATVRAARAMDPDVLVTSALCLGTLLAAETLDLPIIVIGYTAHLWNYREGSPTEPESQSGRQWRLTELLRYHQQVRDQLGLPGKTDPRTLIGSGLLLRGEPAFEHPGSELPDNVHHVGPCFWEPPPDTHEVDEINNRLSAIGKPVVYVHLGRFFGGESLWPQLNAVFTDGKFQAVVERGRSGPAAPTDRAHITVIRKPWMRPLVRTAALVLTCATSAAVLGALTNGRPLVVAPMGSEQPVLAAACIRLGVAVRLPNHPHTSAAVLAEAYDCQTLAARAQEVGTHLSGLPAETRAADLIHTATSHPTSTS